MAPSFGLQQPSPLWLRPLASTSGRLLTGTEGASFPFWSPDGRSIGFFADEKLKRLDVNSQAIQILADAPIARGGAWQADGTILFAPNAIGPLFRVPAHRRTADRRHAAREGPERSSRAVHPSRRATFPLLRQRGRRKSAGYTWLASMAPRRSGCSTRTVPPSMHDRVICCFRGRGSCWRSLSMPRGWRSTVKPFASLTASPSIQGSASPRSPRQHPDRLRTARTASVERSSPGSIVLAGGSRPLVHRIKEAWPILRCRPTAVGSLSAASSVGTGTCG